MSVWKQHPEQRDAPLSVSLGHCPEAWEILSPLLLGGLETRDAVVAGDRGMALQNLWEMVLIDAQILWVSSTNWATSQLYSDTDYPESVQSPQVEGVSLTRPLSLLKRAGYPAVCTSNLAANPGFPHSALSFGHLREQLTELREHATLNITVHYRGCKWTACSWKWTWSEVQKSPEHTTGAHYPPGTRVCPPSWKIPERPHLEVFMEVSLYRHDWLNHWLLVMNSSPSPLLRGLGVGPKVPTFGQGLDLSRHHPSSWSSPPLGPHQKSSHLQKRRLNGWKKLLTNEQRCS